jgi:CRISPR/Cas system-associated exonuclease Cas4 (RecB family)
VIWDLKTGRAHPRRGREAAPDAVLDIQIAIYGLAARLLAAEWGVPGRVSAGYAYVGHGADQRAWQELDEELEPAARQWLELAAELLEARTFPRTPDPEDCKYCHLRPVCGEGAQKRAARLLAGGDPLLARFRALKHPAADTED